MPLFSNTEIKKISDTEVEISAEISAETFDSYRASAVRHLAEEVSIDGFRRGRVPEAVLIQKIGEGAILHEMAEAALRDAYPEILREHAVRAIGAPSITLTKLARGNPLGFRAKTAVMPEIILPDYKKIARDALAAADEIISVTDENVERTVMEIRKNFAKMETGGDIQQATPHTRAKLGTGQAYNIQKSDSLPETVRNVKRENEEKRVLPDLTDEFVKKLGNFQTVDEFRARIKENLREEKVLQQKEKKRVAVIGGLLSRAAFSVPALLVDAEKERMLAQFKGQIAQMGAKPEDYFARIKKTEEEVKKEWSETAKKKVRTQIILDEIALKEGISPDEKAVAEETERLMEYYKDADPARTRAYVEGILSNEAVFAFLEWQNNSTNTR